MRNNEIDTGSPEYFRGVEFASLGQRWGAGAIDYLLIPAIVLFFFAVLGHMVLVGYLIAIAVLVLNVVWLQGRCGVSVGKFSLGLTTFVVITFPWGESVLAYTGSKCCAVRLFFFLVLDIACIFIGLFRPAFDPWGRCFSDSLTNTFVAKVDRSQQYVRPYLAGQVIEFPRW
jgi:hypothetical protein